MSDTTIKDRAAGAIMGAFIGDALGLGPHWYYDLAELRRDYGEWICDYTDPQPGRYHAGLKAGQSSQAGYILKLTLRSLVACGGYDEADFCRRMDEELLPLLDGTPLNGPGGYTSQSIRDLWHKRVQQKLPWGQTGGHADTTEAIERTLALAVRYTTQEETMSYTRKLITREPKSSKKNKKETEQLQNVISLRIPTGSSKSSRTISTSMCIWRTTSSSPRRQNCDPLKDSTSRH